MVELKNHIFQTMYLTSLMKRKNNEGQTIDPWGTSETMTEKRQCKVI